MNKSQDQESGIFRKLRLGVKISHFLYTAIVLTFLPFLTVGTSYHQRAVEISHNSAHGMFLVSVYFGWAKFIIWWFDKTGRQFKSSWVLPVFFLGAIPGTFVSIAANKMFNHKGDWETTLEISWGDLMNAVAINLILVPLIVYVLHIVAQFRTERTVPVKDRDSGITAQVIFLYLLVPLIVVAFMMVLLFRVLGIG